MKNFSLFIALVFVFFYSSPIKSQVNTSYKFEKITTTDFSVKPPAIDSNANAIVIADVGSTEFEGNANGFFSLVFKIHERILLRNRNAFDEATVKFTLSNYGSSSDAEKVNDIEAATYTLVNGQVKETKLEKSGIFTEKVSKYYTNCKFTLPNLAEGCIIDYKYTVRSPFQNSDIRSWRFQQEYPTLWSEYAVAIPYFYKYVTLKKSYLPFAIDTVWKKFKNYSVIDAGDATESSTLIRLSGDDIIYHWAMKNVPAFKAEPYITTSKNYIPRVQFFLHSIQYSETAPKRIIMKNWMERMHDLLNDENFGKPLTENNSWLKSEIEDLTKNTTTLQGAKNIWQYVRDNFICTDNDNKFLSQPLKKTFQTKKGNVADINLLLTAMLLQKGYTATPVLISTRDNGYPIETESILSQFNYVITQLVIDSTNYFLDATESRLGFGKLPEKCYNESGRLVATMPYLVNLSADSLVEKKSTISFISADDKGKITGSITSDLGYYESHEIRNKLVTTKQEDFTKNLAKSYPPEIEITNIQLDSVNNYDEPITVTTEFNLKFEDDVEYFNPLFNEGWKNNPFSAAERLYPVEMPYVMNEIYNFNMQIPPGYEVDELPQSARVKLNENEGMFEYLIIKSGDNIQMRSSIILAKANYLPEDYQTLRDFFSYIVKKQAEPIVFKKKK